MGVSNHDRKGVYFVEAFFVFCLTSFPIAACDVRVSKKRESMMVKPCDEAVQWCLLEQVMHFV